MDEIKNCIMCGNNHKVLDAGNYKVYFCDNNKRYKIHDSIINKKDTIIGQRWLNAIYEYVERTPFIDYENSNIKGYWQFYYDEKEQQFYDKNSINVYQLMKQNPLNVIERIDKIMYNLSQKYPLLSDTFNILEIEKNEYRLLYCESVNRTKEIASIFSALLINEFIELAETYNNDINKNRYRISIKGWKYLAELTKKYDVLNYGFIAMSFDPSVEYIQESFIKAINQAGYEPRIIKDKEHNNYIMPEIFHEIEQSKFVVVDITKPNFGAYYEAGYAQALGKEVIVCCKEDVFKSADTRPHFDIVQKSMILWTDENDLIYRLKRRIAATVKK